MLKYAHISNFRGIGGLLRCLRFVKSNIDYFGLALDNLIIFLDSDDDRDARLQHLEESLNTAKFFCNNLKNTSISKVEGVNILPVIVPTDSKGAL